MCLGIADRRPNAQRTGDNAEQDLDTCNQRSDCGASGDQPCHLWSCTEVLRDYAFRNSGGDKYFFGQPGSDYGDQFASTCHTPEGEPVIDDDLQTSTYNSVDCTTLNGSCGTCTPKGLSEGDDGYVAAKASCAQLGPQSKNRDDNRTVCEQNPQCQYTDRPCVFLSGTDKIEDWQKLNPNYPDLVRCHAETIAVSACPEQLRAASAASVADRGINAYMANDRDGLPEPVCVSKAPEFNDVCAAVELNGNAKSDDKKTCEEAGGGSKCAYRDEAAQLFGCIQRVFISPDYPATRDDPNAPMENSPYNTNMQKYYNDDCHFYATESLVYPEDAEVLMGVAYGDNGKQGRCYAWEDASRDNECKSIPLDFNDDVVAKDKTCRAYQAPPLCEGEARTACSDGAQTAESCSGGYVTDPSTGTNHQCAWDSAQATCVPWVDSSSKKGPANLRVAKAATACSLTETRPICAYRGSTHSGRAAYVANCVLHPPAQNQSTKTIFPSFTSLESFVTDTDLWDFGDDNKQCILKESHTEAFCIGDGEEILTAHCGAQCRPLAQSTEADCSPHGHDEATCKAQVSSLTGGNKCEWVPAKVVTGCLQPKTGGTGKTLTTFRYKDPQCRQQRNPRLSAGEFDPTKPYDPETNPCDDLEMGKLYPGGCYPSVIKHKDGKEFSNNDTASSITSTKEGMDLICQWPTDFAQPMTPSENFWQDHSPGHIAMLAMVGPMQFAILKPFAAQHYVAKAARNTARYGLRGLEKAGSERAGKLADKLKRNQVKADFKRKAKQKVTRQMKKEAKEQIRREAAEQGVELEEDEVTKKAKDRVTAQVKKQIAEDIAADGLEDGGEAAGEAVVSSAADAAVGTALEAGGEALLTEGAELAADELIVGEVAGSLAATGVGAPVAAALEAGMQVYAVGDLALTLAEGAVESGLASAAEDAVVEGVGAAFSWGADVMSFGAGLFTGTAGLYMDGDIYSQMTSGGHLTDSVHRAYGKVKEDMHKVAQTASKVEHHVQTFFEHPLDQTAEVVAEDPVLAMDVVTGSPAQAGVDLLLRHTDTGKSITKSVSTAEYHMAQWWKNTF